MRIALLAPAGAMHRYNGNFKKSLHYAPLTLTTLAALVPQELMAEVAIYDETVGIIPKDIEADLIGITAITGTSMRAYKWADYYRSKGITVVMGGVHPTLMPQEAAEHADCVVTGFAEQTWPRLLEDFVGGKLQKFYCQDEDLDISGRPIPRRELLNRKRYITINSVEAIRGCNLPCSFCAFPAAFGRNLYKRPVREVIEEIEKLNSKEVLFPDVNLVADREYAKELFREMIPLKKWWFGLTTSDVAKDSELFDIIVKSGCRGLLIGFESFTQDSQKFVKKGINKVGEYEELMKKLHHAGIGVNGCLAFGGDEEDRSVFERTVEAVVKLKIDLPRYSILTPFPGTQLYREFDEQDRIIENNWAMYDVEHCVFKPKNMTVEELEEGIEWAWRETYTFMNIAKRLSTFGTPHIASVPANVFGYRVYADKFRQFTREVMIDNSDI
ncbi:MAG: B12-binding domain-containing radical SAM protein [Clostridiaceae bacterium]|nr:B12-binding domain-containing radical SAM protein [Clostridiaceae bacterium]